MSATRCGHSYSLFALLVTLRCVVWIQCTVQRLAAIAYLDGRILATSAGGISV